MDAPFLLALADDMTGALEVAAKFRAAGIGTVLSASPVVDAGSTALVLDTETRHLTSDAAYREVARFIKESKLPAPALIYKKTDSTLRGNICAELQAIADAFPGWDIGYAPAYPALGRTVRDGVLYVGGDAVSETEFARDALNPIGCSSIRKLVAQLPGCVVFDGETDRHLDEAAATVLSRRNMRIAAGPAGLAEAIARILDVPREAPPPLPSIDTCLMLNGSRHSRAVQQIQYDRLPGWRIVTQTVSEQAAAEEVAASNAWLLARECECVAPDAVLIIGGDTAFAFLRHLGFPSLTPIGEAVPGVPVTRLKNGMYLITKAGGFGDVDVLRRVHGRLRKHE